MNDFNWCKLNISNSTNILLMGNACHLFLNKEYYREKKYYVE